MRVFKTFLIVVMVVLAVQFAGAQTFNSAVTTLTPVLSYAPVSFTATSQTSSTIFLGGVQSGIIQVTGSSLTTATFAIQGSIDGGTTWFSLPTAAYPTTAAPSTLAVTQTATATATYVVNLTAIPIVRFVTSGTFTATSISVKLSAMAGKGYL